MSGLSIGGNKSKYKGIFVKKLAVASVTDLSHQTLEYIGKAFDLAIKVSFIIPQQTFTKDITIFGNFKRGADGQVESLGSAFKVARFFNAFGINDNLTPTNEIPAEWCSSVVGKEAFTIDYLVGVKENGKGKYYASDLVDTDEDFLVNDFYKGVAKGFPKNFNPTALDAGAGAGMGDAYEGAPLGEAPAMAEEMVF